MDSDKTITLIKYIKKRIAKIKSDFDLKETSFIVTSGNSHDFTFKFTTNDNNYISLIFRSQENSFKVKIHVNIGYINNGYVIHVVIHNSQSDIDRFFNSYLLNLFLTSEIDNHARHIKNIDKEYGAFSSDFTFMGNRPKISEDSEEGGIMGRYKLNMFRTNHDMTHSDWGSMNSNTINHKDACVLNPNDWRFCTSITFYSYGNLILNTSNDKNKNLIDTIESKDDKIKAQITNSGQLILSYTIRK